MLTVSFSRRSGCWQVLGVPRMEGQQGELVLVPEDLVHVRAVDLKNALSSWLDYFEGQDPDSTAVAHVTMLPGPYEDEEAILDRVSFAVRGSKLFVITSCSMDWPGDGDENTAVQAVTKLVAPLIARNRSQLETVSVVHAWSDQFGIVLSMEIEIPWRGRMVDELFRVGEEVAVLCDAFASGDVTRETVGDLVRGGGAHLLVGQEEGNWLDAKVEEYDLAGPRERISLAQAVARFANAEDGGLIVFGVRAKKIPGGEVIRGVKGVVPRYNDSRARYLNVLNHHLYPPLYGVRIDVIPTNDGRFLIVVDIPPQPEELKPFLVHGAITTGGDTEGAFISIVRRRGEGSIPITAPMIHASIAAGRALLRGSHEAMSADPARRR